MKIILAIVAALALAALAGAGYVYSGAFEVAADVPHSALVYGILEIARDKGIATRAKGIAVPRLDEPKMIAEGAKHYGAMCDGCHLAPGMQDNEFRKGLYPQPPDLSKDADMSPAEAFWVVKHGLKMTAMPAWGLTHDDSTIWSIVAFVKALPGLTPEQYRQMTANPPQEHAEPAPGPDAGGTGKARAGDAKTADHHH